MRKLLRLFAGIIAVTTLAVWFKAGAHRGWTQTAVQVKTVDEVTGLEGVEYRKQFVPGIDFLAAAAGVIALLTGASFAFKKPKS